MAFDGLKNVKIAYCMFISLEIAGHRVSLPSTYFTIANAVSTCGDSSMDSSRHSYTAVHHSEGPGVCDGVMLLLYLDTCQCAGAKQAHLASREAHEVQQRLLSSPSRC